jgi:hypothetical protein
MTQAPVAPSEAANWYVASDGGKHLGPFTKSALGQMAASGKLRREDMVWQEGTADWLQAQSVAGVFPPPPASSKPPPAPPPGAASSSAQQMKDSAAKALAPIDKVLSEMSSPRVFRLVGRTSAVLSFLTLLASISLFLFGVNLFAFALLFAVLWIVGEGVASILHSLERLAIIVTKLNKDGD